MLAAASKTHGSETAFLLHALVQLWPLWTIAAAILAGRVTVELYRRHRLSRSGIYEIDRMEGRTFEQFLRLAFARRGYGVELTRYRGDYGADLVMTKGRDRVAVQAKRYGKKVGVKAVQAGTIT